MSLTVTALSMILKNKIQTTKAKIYLVSINLWLKQTSTKTTYYSVSWEENSQKASIFQIA